MQEGRRKLTEKCPWVAIYVHINYIIISPYQINAGQKHPIPLHISLSDVSVLNTALTNVSISPVYMILYQPWLLLQFHNCNSIPFLSCYKYNTWPAKVNLFLIILSISIFAPLPHYSHLIYSCNTQHCFLHSSFCSFQILTSSFIRCHISVLLYGVEVWGLMKRLLDTDKRWQKDDEVTSTWRDGVISETWQRYGVKGLSCALRSRRLSWFEDVKRRDKDCGTW